MNLHVLALKDPKDLNLEFKKIGVDSGGIPIMLPKGFSRLVKISGVPCFWAHILKPISECDFSVLSVYTADWQK